MNYRTILLFCLILFSGKSINANEFKVIFIGDFWRVNDAWLEQIKDWGADEVCMYVNWEHAERTNNNFDFTKHDAAVDMILNHNLKVSIRLAAAVFTPEFVAPDNGLFEKDDFQITYDGTIFTQNDPRYTPLNFASPVSKQYLKKFFRVSIEHFNGKYPGQIVEYVPSVSREAEFEYPYAKMCGYSKYEIEGFRSYLKNIYGNISTLNRNWGSSYISFSLIDPLAKNLNWYMPSHEMNGNYVYPSGRVDWMNFRTLVLKSFIDECADLIHSYNSKMGIQIGSIYDSEIERRGWYDPTTLFEKVDAIRHDDLLYYRPNFNFGADYLRSITNYWERNNGKNISFSTELTWPDYPNTPKHDNTFDTLRFPSPVLDSLYTIQLKSFYDRGASAIYLTLWDRFDMNSLKNNFPSLRQALLNYNTTVNIFPESALHLSAEQGNFTGNKGFEINTVIPMIKYYSFYFNNSSKPAPGAINKNYDVITNYMISNSPSYISEYYRQFVITHSSEFMPEKVFTILKQSSLNIIPSAQNIETFAGAKDEYNRTRLNKFFE